MVLLVASSPIDMFLERTSTVTLDPSALTKKKASLCVTIRIHPSGMPPTSTSFKCVKEVQTAWVSRSRACCSRARAHKSRSDVAPACCHRLFEITKDVDGQVSRSPGEETTVSIDPVQAPIVQVRFAYHLVRIQSGSRCPCLWPQHTRKDVFGDHQE